MAMSAAASTSSTSVLLRRTIIASRRVTIASTSSPRLRYLSSTTSDDSTSSSASSSSSSSYSSSRVPPPSLPPTPSALLTGVALLPDRLKPTSPEFYTSRPTYIALLLQLQDLQRRVKRALQELCIIKGNAPLPTPETVGTLIGMTKAEMRVSMGGGVLAPLWLKIRDVGGTIGTPLTTSQYRNITDALTGLGRYAPLVKKFLSESSRTDYKQLAQEVEQVVQSFRRRSLDESELHLKPTAGTGIDSKGRIWASGGRKESSAVVWIAPLPPSSSLGEVMVNGFPISTYFSRTKHREDILYPLRLVNLLGQFNIFTLVSGGGHSGQAGAIAHGLAKAIVRFFQNKHQESITNGDDPAKITEWETLKDGIRSLLLKDGVLKRDPRMVERKKTGLAKARKAYTWVKR